MLGSESGSKRFLALLIIFRVGKGRHLNNIRTVRISAALIGPDHVLRRHVLSVVELYRRSGDGQYKANGHRKRYSSLPEPA